MRVPNLKRLKIGSEQDLRGWLAKAPHPEDRVMLVTHCKSAHPNYVSREQVEDALSAHGWVAGPRYTLNATLLGHVIRKQ